MTKFSSLKAALGAVVLAGSLLAAVPASFATTSPPIAVEVLSQLNDVIASHGPHGYRTMVADWASIRRDGNGEMWVQLRAGTDYLFAARCDGDCNDVDMALEDAQGNELKADRDPDDTPSFSFRPARSGSYRIKIELARCWTRHCNAGVIVLQRDQPTLNRLAPTSW